MRIKNISSVFKRIFGVQAKTYPPPVEVYSGLRTMIFDSRPTGWSASARSEELWGVLMESGYLSGVATLVALADGTVSLYYSTGGGAIGLGPNDGVARAFKTLLSTAPNYSQYFRPTTEYPLPLVGRTRLYFLTKNQTLTAEGDNDDLGHGQHVLSPLFHVAHSLISEIRLEAEKQQTPKN